MNKLSSMQISFVRVLEMNLMDLFECEEICLSDGLFNSYFRILLYYLSGSKVELKSFLAGNKNTNPKDQNLERQVAMALGELRFLILEKQSLKDISLAELKEKYEKIILGDSPCLPGLWLGEWYFVWARLCEMKGDHLESSHHYFEAKKAYEEIGASKKAVKAYFNGVICQERCQEGHNLHYQHVQVIKEARTVQEYSVVGMALLALSQKLLDIGALRSALSYVQRSLAFLNKEKGSSNYFKALLHRAYLYYLTGKSDKAETDYQEAKLSTHVEVLAALEVMEKKANRSGLDSVRVATLPYAWISRLHYENGNLLEWGAQEEQLIQILLKRPTSKNVILTKIWGSTEVVDPEHIDLRFKKLMWRIKKKLPHLIFFSNGLYSLKSLGS